MARKKTLKNLFTNFLKRNKRTISLKVGSRTALLINFGFFTAEEKLQSTKIERPFEGLKVSPNSKANALIIDDYIFHKKTSRFTSHFLLCQDLGKALAGCLNSYPLEATNKLRTSFVKPISVGSSMKEYLHLIDKREGFKKIPLAKFGFVTLINPSTFILNLINATNFNLKLIVLITKDYSYNKFKQYVVSNNTMIDSILIPDAYKADEDDLRCFKNINYYRDYKNLGQEVNRIIGNLDHKGSYLLPILKGKFYIHDIVPLSERRKSSSVDILLYLTEPVNKNSNQASKVRFTNIIDDIAAKTDSILMKEDVYFKYSNFVKNKNIVDFLKVTLKDGCRYEVRERNNTH